MGGLIPIDDDARIYQVVFHPPPLRSWKPVAQRRDWRGRLWVLHPTKGWRLG